VFMSNLRGTQPTKSHKPHPIHGGHSDQSP
jgi:hypothetical protein